MASTIKEVAIWFGALGVPTIFTIAMACAKSCVKFSRQLRILCAAQKAQMRSQLIEQFHHYEEQGWVSDQDLTEWCNQHAAYHELVGNNGVLEAKKDILIHMPNKAS